MNGDKTIPELIDQIVLSCHLMKRKLSNELVRSKKVCDGRRDPEGQECGQKTALDRLRMIAIEVSPPTK
jgi:hypothetical protein